MSRPYTVSRSFVWVFFGIPLLIGALALLIGPKAFEPIDIERVEYNKMMQSELVLEEAGGDKIVTLNLDEDEYSKDYLPVDMVASAASEVGAVLYIRVHYSEVEYTGGIIREKEHIDASLIVAKTGEVIAEMSFKAASPITTSGAGTDKVDKNTVSVWVSEKWKNYRSE